MPWLQLKFTIAREAAEPLGEALDACGALAVTVQAASEELLLQAATEDTPLWDRNTVTGLFPGDADATALIAQLRSALSAELPADPVCETLPDADWERAWMDHYAPIAITERLWICPSWIEPPRPQAVNILLDPGLAFGTGSHPTTALCLAWLDEQVLAGRTVIDYGCGSGILAIAALKLGAAQAIGVDVDPKALEVARENAERNGVAGRLATCLPAALPAQASADYVVANILARPLVELAPLLTALVRPHGRIALSGLLADQCDLVLPCYAGAFTLEVREQRGWLLLCGPRRDGDSIQ